MNKYNFIIFTLGALFLISSCSNKDNRHRDLVNFLDSGTHHFTIDSVEVLDDMAIIELLTEASNYNQYVKESNRDRADKVDATNYLKNLIVFQEYLKELTKSEKFKTDTISLDTAIKYHRNYLKAREDAAKIAGVPDGIKKDKSEASLFTWPKIIGAIQDTYDPEPSDWIDSNFWQNKGFFVFLANYGSNGHYNNGSVGSDTLQTSVIFQLATDVVPDPISGPDRWRVAENQLYNFGDLKPPKIKISNPDKAPH
jgi:hypothetical protein